MILKIDEKEVEEWVGEATNSGYSKTHDSGPGSRYRSIRFDKNSRRIRLVIQPQKAIIKLKRNYSTYRKPSSILDILNS